MTDQFTFSTEQRWVLFLWGVGGSISAYSVWMLLNIPIINVIRRTPDAIFWTAALFVGVVLLCIPFYLELTRQGSHAE